LFHADGRTHGQTGKKLADRYDKANKHIFTILRTLPKMSVNLHGHNRASIISITFFKPTNAYNVKNVDLLKHIKIMEADPTCFGLQRNHYQGATASA